jgi:integral membrane sensor domain MASE1
LAAAASRNARRLRDLSRNDTMNDLRRLLLFSVGVGALLVALVSVVAVVWL